MRPAIYSDGSKQYEYILLCFDNARVIVEHHEKLFYQGIGKYFQLKEKSEESVGPPKIYLGGS
eukprot:4892375-Ditylum_brightwellii.AAC.1